MKRKIFLAVRQWRESLYWGSGIHPDVPLPRFLLYCAPLPFGQRQLLLLSLIGGFTPRA